MLYFVLILIKSSLIKLPLLVTTSNMSSLVHNIIILLTTVTQAVGGVTVCGDCVCSRLTIFCVNATGHHHISDPWVFEAAIFKNTQVDFMYLQNCISLKYIELDNEYCHLCDKLSYIPNKSSNCDVNLSEGLVHEDNSQSAIMVFEVLGVLFCILMTVGIIAFLCKIGHIIRLTVQTIYLHYKNKSIKVNHIDISDTVLDEHSENLETELNELVLGDHSEEVTSNPEIEITDEIHGFKRYML